MTTDTHRHDINSANAYALAVRGNSGAFIGNLFDELWFWWSDNDQRTVPRRLLSLLSGCSASLWPLPCPSLARRSPLLPIPLLSQLNRVQQTEGGCRSAKTTFQWACFTATAWHLSIHTAEHEEVSSTAWPLSLQCFGETKPQK